MNSKEIGQWCLDNKKYLAKIILRHDRKFSNFEDNFNHLVCELMKTCSGYNPNKGVKFITYVYRPANGIMGKYMTRKRLKLSYPDWIVNTPKGKQVIEKMNIENNITGGFGFVPDFVEGRAIDINKTDRDAELDRQNLIAKINHIIENHLPPVQKRFMEYRYDKELRQVHTLNEYAQAFGVTYQAGKNNELSAIKTIQKRLGIYKKKERKI